MSRTQAVASRPATAVGASLAMPGLDGHVERLARAVRDGTRAFPVDLDVDLRRACRDALDLGYRYALQGAYDDGEVARVAQVFVELEIGLDVVTRIIRSAHQEALAAASITSATDPTAEALARRSAQTWSRTELVIGELVAAYSAEQRRREESGQAAQIAALDAVLRDGPGDVSVFERDLGYALDGTHVSFVVRRDREGVDRAAMRRAAESHAASQGGTDLLCVDWGPSTLRCWSHVTAKGPNSQVELAPTALTIASSEAHDGLDGFRRALDEAVKTHRLVVAAGRLLGPVTRFADVSLLVLLSSDLQAARHFVDRRLGPLLTDNRNMRGLLETLEVYFEQGLSATRSAVHLDLHANTVAYRIRRVESLLGHPAEQRMFDTWAALALHGVLRARHDGS